MGKINQTKKAQFKAHHGPGRSHCGCSSRRSAEALPLLLTLSSGVTGYTTIHAGTARQALTRLRFIAQLADTSSELPLSALNSLVSESVDVVVHCARIDGRLEVTEILIVEDLQSGIDSASFTTTTLFNRENETHQLQWTGNLPERSARALSTAGYDIRNANSNNESWS